jgi:hypothetical protein
MKSFVPLTFLAGLLVAGCASDNSNSNFSSVPGPSGGVTVAVPNEEQAAPAQSQPAQMTSQSNTPPAHAIVTPDNSLAGKVVTYNSVGRFVVLRFPADRMPRNGQTLFVYRDGLKVGELKISGEQRDNFIVADVVSGDAQPGDDVRDQ